jgi:tRNA (guanine-N7-)-methyltransferase
MTAAQKRSYDKFFSSYCLDFCRTGETGKTINFEKTFGNKNAVVIEIGFGMGLATALIAEKNPETNYVGLEVYRTGIGRLLWEIEKRRLANIRIIEGDAAEILPERIGENSVAGFHIFFPDPWPKKRHHKRRLIKRPFTDLLASRLVPGGYVYMVTDWEDYGDWALAELSATPGLGNKYPGFAPPQAWRPETKFERKGIEGQRRMREIFFEKPGQEEATPSKMSLPTTEPPSSMPMLLSP